MSDSRVYTEPRRNPSASGAGIISRIRLENFMCHSSLHIEFDDWVNFITGQNGSGKSAILTALCVAFGCRARGTQRAATLKDFIKTGCSYSSVTVEIKNQGEDAFKHETYGDLIIIERRITESTNSIVLKDRQGRKVSQRRDELRELVEHFNIDVENPCVIMTQDKSREFLHSGNDKDKFKFFFKATLLQQVSELLQSIRNQLDAADAIVDELESSIRPITKELNELREKIKNMEHVEEISLELQNLKKKLAWSWVYCVDGQIQEQKTRIEKLKERVPTCQARIDKYLVKVGDLKGVLLSKKTHIKSLMEKTSEVRRMKDDLQQNLSVATKERLELEEDHVRGINLLKKMKNRVRLLEQQIHGIQEQHIKETQAEEYEIEERIKKLEDEINEADKSVRRLQEEENAISESLAAARNAIRDIDKEIDECERKHRDLHSYSCELQQRQTNKVTAFGGEKVLYLLQIIERHHRKFKSPPIGPIGAHVTLVNGDSWALAVDCAIGRLLDAFIVTNHKDSLALRACAREARYQNLQIIIYDFSMPRLSIPSHDLPSTNHPTTLSVIHTENPTVMNVLVDMGNAERQVLVKDYEMGKAVAFEQRIRNLKEVYTSDGYRMFCRGSVQTTLPPNKRARAGRLCGSIDDQISDIRKEIYKVQEFIQEGRGRKRDAQEALQNLEGRAQSLKRQRIHEERPMMSKKLALRDMQNAYAAERHIDQTANVEELYEEISQIQDDIQGKELLLEKIHVRKTLAEEKANDLKKSFESLCDSAKGEIDAIEGAEHELLVTEEELRAAEAERVHYEGVMNNKVLPDIKAAEEHYEELHRNRQENFDKASIICPECEVEALGGCASNTPEHFSAKINRLKQRLQRENMRYDESIDDLRVMYEKKERKILKRQQMYSAFRNKLIACQEALDLRWSKFQRNASLLKRQLTWQFNGHLKKKGMSGHIKVDYEKMVLSIEVKMPQDASGNTVRDTRGLSGGERSFSTLCFALALHEMTEAPFRAMDEFDVFMDAVSRKISLDTLIDFAVEQGSQWIFITPHDISMVKAGQKVRKQQMAAPRS
ncbi:structural maintenance of chromosomes protein 6B-like [Asparagus officinalis]|uniref:structural maintenance of chromosomes protein 6B-like n=1 Tax=Asparagus officinalis TaxID=4686 RepID=UPI00098E57D9|nr:structural maintenance of chromosomes protein 6B-like [Asparagus officinalis]